MFGQNRKKMKPKLGASNCLKRSKNFGYEGQGGKNGFKMIIFCMRKKIFKKIGLQTKFLPFLSYVHCPESTLAPTKSLKPTEK